MGSCAAPSAKGDDKFITTDYLQQCRKPEYTPGCAPEKSRTLCWYDFGVQYCQDVTAEKDGGSGCLCPCMETLALDDALDVLDAMLAVIIRDARKIGQKKRLRSLKDLDKSALALASACSYLLKEETPDESIRAEVFSYIPRQKLAEIITLVREIARPSDDNFHEEMKCGAVRARSSFPAPSAEYR